MQPHTVAFEHVRVYLTARDTGDRLSPQTPLAFQPLEQPLENNPTIMLDPEQRFQTIEGFGGAFTDAAAETFCQLSEAEQQAVLRAYFDPSEGIGYTLCRTHINSCDFSSESYAYAGVPGDTALAHFSIEHDRRYRIPFIRKAIGVAGSMLRIFASPWSPPAWMKTNNHMLHGGKVKPEYHDAWARYFVYFVHAYEAEGIPIWGLTVQNEPMAVQTWESCIYTAAEERDFVRDHLGPALEEAGLKRLKLMVWDHNRGLVYQRAKVVYDDPEAARYVWGTGYHWYDGDHYHNLQLVHDAWPDKQLLSTEAAAGPFRWEQMDDWRWGEQYGRSVLLDLKHWAVGWVDWNLLVDERGGPNHVGNYCYAPIVGDTRTGEAHYLNIYYYLGHFARFIRPGSVRIACACNDDELLATAFATPADQIVVVALNLTDKALGYRVWIDGQAASTVAPAHSIATLILER
jgi:glucosylceramidase